ncbi:MAG: hypothetical protein N3A65_09925, partial [candidate division WOR-3 bacterium]|nr:hypothetical protein [candidate division WOR-3 bacterium]
MVVLSMFLAIIEPEIYLCNPVSTPYGVILTNNHCNSLYLLTDNGLKEIYTAPGCGRYFSLSYDKSKIGLKIINENGMQTPAIYDLKSKAINKLHIPVYQAGQVSFSQNGKIAYTIGEELIVQNQNGTKRFNLGIYANLSPISPDGNFAVYNDNQDQLWLLNLIDNSLICITDNKYGYCYPEWSYDSRFIAYSTLGGFIKVYDRLENRTYEIDEGKSFAWSPDSRYLIYHKTFTSGPKLVNSDLFIAKYDGSEKIRLTNTPGIFEMDPEFVSPKRIIYHNYNLHEINIAEIENSSIKDIKILFRAGKIKINYFKIIPETEIRGDSINVPYVHQVYD